MQFLLLRFFGPLFHFPSHFSRSQPAHSHTLRTLSHLSPPPLSLTRSLGPESSPTHPCPPTHACARSSAPSRTLWFSVFVPASSNLLHSIFQIEHDTTQPSTAAKSPPIKLPPIYSATPISYISYTPSLLLLYILYSSSPPQSAHVIAPFRSARRTSPTIALAPLIALVSYYSARPPHLCYRENFSRPTNSQLHATSSI